MSKRLLADNSCNLLKSRPDKTIPRCVYRQLIKAARHLPPVNQLMSLRVQKVDAAPDPSENSLASSIPKTQVSLQTPFNLSREDFRHQVRDIIRIFFDSAFCMVACDLPKEV